MRHRLPRLLAAGLGPAGPRLGQAAQGHPLEGAQVAEPGLGAGELVRIQGDDVVLGG